MAREKVLEGRDRRGGLLPSWLMSGSKKELNNLAGGTRALVKAIARQTTTGTGKRTHLIFLLCSSRWIAK